MMIKKLILVYNYYRPNFVYFTPNSKIKVCIKLKTKVIIASSKRLLIDTPALNP